MYLIFSSVIFPFYTLGVYFLLLMHKTVQHLGSIHINNSKGPFFRFSGGLSFHLSFFSQMVCCIKYGKYMHFCLERLLQKIADFQSTKLGVSWKHKKRKTSCFKTTSLASSQRSSVCINEEFKEMAAKINTH